MRTCAGCGKTLWNKFFTKIGAEHWHEECARCCVCGTALLGRCFERAGQLYCKEDYKWLFRPHCFLCDLSLDPTDYVYRAKSFLPRGETPQHADSFRSCHVDCLSCSFCDRRLRSGEAFSLCGSLVICLAHSADALTWQSDPVVVPLPSPPPSPLRIEGQCPENRSLLPPGFSPHIKSEKHEPYDFQVPTPGSIEGDSMKPTTSDRTSEKSETSESTQWEEFDSTTGGLLSKRPRTVLTSSQRRRFKLIFELSPKPNRKVREALAAEMELSSRVVQVWFQNQRAKIKKLARRNAQKSQRKCDPLKVCAMLPDASYFEDSSSGPECSPSAQSSLLESAGSKKLPKRQANELLGPAMASSTELLSGTPRFASTDKITQTRGTRRHNPGDNQPRDPSTFHRAGSGGWEDEELAHIYRPPSFSCDPSPNLCAASTPVVTIINSGAAELITRMECLPHDVPATTLSSTVPAGGGG